MNICQRAGKKVLCARGHHLAERQRIR